MSDYVTREEALRIAKQNAAQDRAEFRRRRSANLALAQKRARAGKTRSGGSKTGGAEVALVINQGFYRAIRHSPGVAEALWDLGERMADIGNRQVEAHSHPEDRHFVVDGKGGKPNNRKASYRVAVIPRTRAARKHQHEDHVLEAAVTQVKGRS